MPMSLLYCDLADAEATGRLGFALGQALPAGSVLLLEGDLGAGKTTLVQSIGAGLGVSDTIDSPTFTLINEYPEGRVPLYHLDLYRLDPEQAAALHLETYWTGDEVDLGIVAIEWSERLIDRPSDYLVVRLSYIGARRKVEVEPIGNFSLSADHLATLLAAI
jgi:tRNA threonylcarbamoyladenosine biosynthesis protein TsaE